MMWLPKGLTPPKPDNQGWWKHGSTNCKWVNRPAGYLAKYSSKTDQKNGLPPGFRMWGVTGLRGTWRDLLRWWLAPSWLKDFVTPGDALRRVGPWWENRTTGVAYKSPYTLVDYIGGRMIFAGPDWSEELVRFL